MNTVHAALARIVGESNVLVAEADVAPYVRDWRGRFQGKALAVVRPKTTEEVSQVMRWAHENQVQIVPQGGNTGLVGAGVPDDSGCQVVLSLQRLNAVRSVDLANDSVVVEAGCILADVQKLAAEANRLFPLSLASEGSCQIGGTIATNAGGLEVIRYGPMRDSVLGLEVVLPDGRVLASLTKLRKNNTGYDLKQLYIGSEGTLGVITAACLKLAARPSVHATAFVGVGSPEAALQLLTDVKSELGSRLSTFEVMSDAQLQIVLRHSGLSSPFDAPHAWYVLLELTEAGEGAWLEEELTSKLGAAMEAGTIENAAIAQSETQRSLFWSLRHRVSESNVREGKVLSLDTSVPVSATAAFIRAAAEKLAGFPGATLCFVGHLGDGNVHVVLIFDVADGAPKYAEDAARVSDWIYEITAALGGSISAEHGIGVALRDKLPRFKADIELGIMKSIKGMLDPRNIMNPGKLL